MDTQYSVNEKAAEIVGFRLKEGQTVVPFDTPAELGYHCPVCDYRQSEDEVYDLRLDWSEYRFFLYCYTCDKDYPTPMCMLDIDKSIDVFLACMNDQAKLATDEAYGQA